MRMTPPLVNRLARHAAVVGATAGVLAGFVAGLLPHVNNARAQPVSLAAAAAHAETWVCTEAAASSDPALFPVELVLKDGVLSEQPFGTPRYDLLANTSFAIVGEYHFGDFDPVLGTVSIFIATMIIDRTSGRFTSTMSVSGAAPIHRTGRCRKFQEGVHTIDGTLARRN